MKLDKQRTAVVLADIQNDFLTEGGVYYRCCHRHGEER